MVFGVRITSLLCQCLQNTEEEYQPYVGTLNKCQATKKNKNQASCKQLEMCFPGTSSVNNPRPVQRYVASTYRQAPIQSVCAGGGIRFKQIVFFKWIEQKKVVSERFVGYKHALRMRRLVSGVFSEWWPTGEL